MGYVVYIDVKNYSVYNNGVESPTPSPQQNGGILPPYPNSPYPNNPLHLPLVTNYTITIPEIIPKLFGYAVINMRFIAPSSSLQSEENWTVNFKAFTLPFPFTTWLSNSSTSSNPYSSAEILPAVFNGTTIDVKVNVYQYNGEGIPNPIQFVASKEWNVTEYIYT
jgi:hypothetical protein